MRPGSPHAFALLTFVLLWVCPVAPAPAQGPRDANAPSAWWPEVEEGEKTLLAGNYRKAEKKARKLGEEIQGKSWHGADLREVLSRVALQRALAEANLGRRREALWHWHTALNIDPRIAEWDLSPYGDAAKLLREFPLRRRGVMPAGFEDRRPRPGEEARRPRAPRFEALTILNNTGAYLERPGRFAMEVVVDEEGLLHHPVVLSTQHNPVTFYATLEWLFQLPPFGPATVGGEPVDQLLDLDVQFHFNRW
jgi:hypothetical protein